MHTSCEVRYPLSEETSLKKICKLCCDLQIDSLKYSIYGTSSKSLNQAGQNLDMKDLDKLRVLILNVQFGRVVRALDAC